MPRNTTHRFTVRMSMIVPIDMLRYDACWPATESDSGKLESMRHSNKPVEVTFETDNPHAPTVGRWESFSCKVVSY